MAKIPARPEFRAWLVDGQGISPPVDTMPDGGRRVVEADVARWATIVRRLGATVE